MKKFTKLSFLLVFGLFSTYLQSAHIIGGTMSYECWGDDTYLVKMELYRNCFSGGADFDSAPNATPATVTIYHGDSQFPFLNLTLPAPYITTIEPDVTDPTILIPPDICIEKGVYEFEVNLPLSNESYHIAYQRCCRVNTLTNIINPGETGITVCTEIMPSAQNVCNSSPTFEVIPSILVLDTLLNYNHSAIDAEGDMLVYEFCCPFIGGGVDQIDWAAPSGVAPDPDMPPPYSPVNFVTPPSSCTQPVGGAGSLTIDPNTGFISGEPIVLGLFVIGICVSEYRDGELLSVTRRDMQIQVVPAEFTGLFSPIQAQDLKITPNPTTNESILQLPNAFAKYELSVFDLNGQLMQEFSKVTGDNFRLETSNLKAGIYLIDLRTAEKRYISKLVIN